MLSDGYEDGRPLTMSDGSGLAEALLGLDGFRVLEVIETAVEVKITVETTAAVVGCPGCGVRARAHDRMPVAIRDLACFGRPARVVWNKRRWRCTDGDCDTKTWTETSPLMSARALLTDRAAVEVCRQVGENARPVSQLAAELGVCWWTVMHAVIEHGTPLVDDPERVGPVRALGVDETSFLAANPRPRRSTQRGWSTWTATSSSTWCKATRPLTWADGSTRNPPSG